MGIEHRVPAIRPRNSECVSRMGKKTIASVDCEIPGGLSEFLPFDSRASLLDWDIVLFHPSITGYAFSHDSYRGRPSLDDGRSFRLQETVSHWRRELSDAVRAGKTVFLFLPELQEVFIDTGRRQYSGTGRNRQTTCLVSEYSNYKTVPLELTVVASEGKAIALTRAGVLLADYWREFSAHSVHKVLISGKIGEPLLVTKSGQKTVGALVQNRDTGGAMILLPYLNMWSEAFYVEKEVEEGKVSDEDDQEERSEETETELVWTEEGLAFGRKLRNSILEIDRSLRESFATTPVPNWATASEYTLPREREIREALLNVESELGKLETRKDELKTKMIVESLPRRLLYEKGPALESAIVHTLETMGFQAARYRDPKSEFDVVFECEEGRLLGEAEGKDNKPISVDKLRQLEMNVHEDYAREGIAKMAKGVLFGNAFRLQPIEKRGEYFTDKCRTAALRSGTTLVRTPDLFRIAQYLSANSDESYAKRCRDAIIGSNGAVVVFPELPVAAEPSVVEGGDRAT